ncbi:MAG: zinc ABC transporter substrate-binding protein, partial [Pseudomonadota bacterium]
LLDAEGTTLLDFRENALFEAHDHDEHGHDDHDHDEHGHDDHGDEEHAKADDHDDHDEHGHDDHDHDEHGHDEHGHDDHGDEEHAKADDHDDHDEHGHDEHGHDDHGHGDHDPHAWLSPDNAAAWLNVIAAQLSAADPDNAGTYFANASAAREDLDDLKTELSGLLEPARGKNFIVFHDAYQYFESDFDFPAAGAISLGDATDPSPARVAEIQQRVQSEGIDCVLAEPQFNPSLVQTVLDGTDANTGVLDPLGSDLTPGQDLYPQLLRNLAQALADCL